MEEAVTSRRELLLLPLGPKRGQWRRVKRRIGRSLASFMLGSCRDIYRIYLMEAVEVPLPYRTVYKDGQMSKDTLNGRCLVR
jgi:hypothetical protein